MTDPGLPPRLQGPLHHRRVRPLPGLLSALALLPLAVACQRRTPPQEEGTLPFVFRSLNLRQQDLKGRPAWELTSPEARYDLRRRVAQALRPSGVIYKDGQPLYRLSATSGTVLDDGAVILLEGAIRVEQIKPQPVLIRASRVRWIPARQLMEIDRHPEAFDAQGRLVARRARFLLDRNQLELRGTPQLQRYSRRFDPFNPTPRGRPELVVTVSRADWEPGTGWLEARGPVRAVRRPPGVSPERPPQILNALLLEGNTVSQEFNLKGPVQLRDPAEDIRFAGTDLRLQVKEQRLRSEKPFTASRGSTIARGDSLLVRGRDDTVEIPSGCWLEQPGESLRARRCSWNWRTQAIEAEGGVALERRVNRQSVRAETLEGSLGPEGQLQLSSPGGRVVSRFQVPKRTAPPRSPAPVRRGPEPVRL